MNWLGALQLKQKMKQKHIQITSRWTKIKWFVILKHKQSYFDLFFDLFFGWVFAVVFLQWIRDYQVGPLYTSYVLLADCPVHYATEVCNNSYFLYVFVW